MLKIVCDGKSFKLNTYQINQIYRLHEIHINNKSNKESVPIEINECGCEIFDFIKGKYLDNFFLGGDEIRMTRYYELSIKLKKQSQYLGIYNDSDIHLSLQDFYYYVCKNFAKTSHCKYLFQKSEFAYFSNYNENLCEKLLQITLIDTYDIIDIRNTNMLKTLFENNANFLNTIENIKEN